MPSFNIRKRNWLRLEIFAKQLKQLWVSLGGFDRAIIALASPRKMTCHNLFITYVYVRSAYLISRQLSRKGELAILSCWLLVCFLSCVSSFLASTYVLVRFFLSTHAAHPRRRTKTQASTRTKQGGRLEMPDEEEGTCKHIEKSKCHLCLLA